MVLTAAFQGLSEAEVAHSREEYGTNALPPPEIETFWDKLKGSARL